VGRIFISRLLFWIHTYVGDAEDHYIGILKPSIGLNFSTISVLDFEHLVYYSDRYTRDYGNFHQVRTEQRINLTLYFEISKQKKNELFFWSRSLHWLAALEKGRGLALLPRSDRQDLHRNRVLVCLFICHHCVFRLIARRPGSRISCVTVGAW